MHVTVEGGTSSDHVEFLLKVCPFTVLIELLREMNFW